MSSGSNGSAWSVDQLAHRLRWATQVTVVVVTGSFLVSSPGAAADPVIPPGASASPPTQAASRVEPDPAGAGRVQWGPGITPPATLPAPDLAPKPGQWHPSSDRPPAVAAGRTTRSGVPVEDTAARTPYSNEFVNPDGSRTKRFWKSHSCRTPGVC